MDRYPEFENRFEKYSAMEADMRKRANRLSNLRLLVFASGNYSQCFYLCQDRRGCRIIGGDYIGLRLCIFDIASQQAFASAEGTGMQGRHKQDVHGKASLGMDQFR